MSLINTGSARQLSLFGVEAADPSPDDLAGLLAGPGRLVRMGGTARVSVVVDGAWRVHVLIAELTRRGLTSSWESVGDGRLAVRTAYTSRLARVARVWLREGAQRPPVGFFLDGHRLRLWVAAAGVVDPEGFVLPLAAGSQDEWRPVGAALAAVGLVATLLPTGSGGPAYRIVGRRRLARLAELVGAAPQAAPAQAWPGG